MFLTFDAGDFKEDEHPRAPDGKFGSKGVAKATPAEKAPQRALQAQQTGSEEAPEP